jgi:argininosuccinate lyase
MPEMQPEKQPKKSWQSRIAEPTDKLAQKFVESISYDRRLYKHDIAGSIAHATMLAKVRLITDSERDAIVEGLKGIERDIEANNFTFDESLEDIHMVIEAELINRIGEPGRKLHTGRSRNDQVATDLVLWLHATSEKLWYATREFQKSFVALADRSQNVVMPSFTHLQRAQPVLAGAEAIAWCSMVERDAWRIDKINADAKKVFPLGSGAIAGTMSSYWRGTSSRSTRRRRGATWSSLPRPRRRSSPGWCAHQTRTPPC